MLFLFTFLKAWWLSLFDASTANHPFKRVNRGELLIPHHFPKKPKWVKQDIIRLKAFMPHASGYTIALTFNRIHRKRKMTVSKSYVYNVFKHHAYEIAAKRRQIKTSKPKTMPNNQLWQLDLTQIKTTQQNNTLAFGIIDAGSRACLCLQSLPNKSSITLLRHLLDTIERYGKPAAIRTDNEIVFTSFLFRMCLACLGIQKQTTQVASPWQNGRVERFFGTLKRYTQQILIPEAQAQLALNQFRVWYNHVRPHQSLNGHTPAEVWNNQSANARGQAHYVNTWDGVLTGFYVPPD